MNELPDLSKPSWFLLASLIVFAVVVGRYFLISGIFYLAFYVWQKDKWMPRKVNQRAYPKGQFRKEIIRSSITSIWGIWRPAIMDVAKGLCQNI